MDYQITMNNKMSNGHTLKATAGFDVDFAAKHNQEPYFRVVADEMNRRGRVVACGMMHEEIAATFPDLKPLLRWHLWSKEGPMHYTANALHWLEGAGGIRKLYRDETTMQCFEHFKALANFGLDDSDEVLDLYRGTGVSDDEWGALVRHARDSLTIKAMAEDVPVSETEVFCKAHDQRTVMMRERLRARVIPWAEARLPNLIELMTADLAKVGIEWP